MTPAELLEHCDAADAVGAAHIVVGIPFDVSLRGWPRGELLSETEEYGRVYRFPVHKIRAWVLRHADFRR